MNGKDIESTAEQSGGFIRNTATESKEELGNSDSGFIRNTATVTESKEEPGNRDSGRFMKKISAGGDSLASSLGLKQVSKSLKRKQLDAITDDSTYRWLFTSIPKRFGGPLLDETDRPSTDAAPAAKGADDDELDPDNMHHWQNYAIAWIVLGSQLAIYIAISVVAVQAIRDYKGTPYGNVSCSDYTAAYLSNGYHSTASAIVSGIKATVYQTDHNLVPTCVPPEKSAFVSYFVGMVVLFGYTFGDRTVVVLIWQNGLRLTALGIASVLSMAYVATGLAIYVSTFNGGGALDIVTTSVGIIFVNDLDEKLYHYLKVMKSPTRRLVSILELFILAITASAVFKFGPLKTTEYGILLTSTTTTSTVSSQIP